MVRIPRIWKSSSNSDEAADDKTLVENDLPMRSKDEDGTGDKELCSLQIHPLPSKEGILVKVIPPRLPANNSELKHVPCDIVLVIDVSGSMGMDAPVPGSSNDPQERNGLSVLDLTKHAARMIIETLDQRDRLGIVAFASQARAIQQLIPMNVANKKKAIKNIENLTPIDATNLWGGILEGIKLFRNGSNDGSVPALMVLTDGMPNHMSPPQGYVPKLRTMEQLPASIHTFGFGYNLRSGLLKSIAEFGGGNYSFIPDAGMIGTVFVHAVANLQTTFADKATLRLTYPSEVLLEQTTGESVELQEPVELYHDGKLARKMTISLGSLQYGQSRDIYLRYDNKPALAAQKCAEVPVMTAVLEYTQMTPEVEAVADQRSLLQDTDLPAAEIDYHVSRSMICSFLASLFPLRTDAEHEPKSWSEDLAAECSALIRAVPAAARQDPLNASLMDDLAGADPSGQVSLALSRQEYWDRWGAHYLPSLAGAHARQACNSFKDQGPLQYGRDSPLFARCRDALDAAFDNLPAPAPSNVPAQAAGRGGRRAAGGFVGGGFSISMSAYNRSSNPCFAGFCRVRLASGRSVKVERLRRGTEVVTPRGARKVAAVLKTRVKREEMVRVGGLLVTPWHPVASVVGAGEGRQWLFPVSAAEARVRYTGSIYSVLLEEDKSPDAHAIMIEGAWGVTLGHGLLHGDDVRAHEFFGDYGKVTRSLRALPASKGGVVLGGGVKRATQSSRVCGFQRPSTRVLFRNRSQRSYLTGKGMARQVVGK
ncbi:uncharacterized protein E0L32_001306 [Thyridium curvatum]|uniref:VWFA domain-containing protein n=1 Tax=Thyridium curvatum TaxID=1093900 RepID=A0A507AYL1_9PEZI|nr:uncharacterized protein E0L32_001306 [Thyridium curvatum]TPX10109.1 hypothetical protein E0L32_001306 [Thyridium curvatum]